MTPWWLGLSAAQTTVRCGEHQHRLRWDRGRLQALDHGDPDAERALAALGGERFTCIELLGAWARHKDDPRALVLGSRGPTDRLQIDPDSLPQRAGRRAPAPPGRARAQASKQARSETELTSLLNLGGGIADRLLGTVAATWSRRIDSGQAGLNKVLPQLHAGLHGRAFASARAWLGEPATAAELIMIGAAQPRSLSRVDDRIHAELPFKWLVEVWAQDLATIHGRFCLAAETTNGRRWRLTTIAADLRDTEVITLDLTA